MKKIEMELQFSSNIGEMEYRNWIRLSNGDPIPSSLAIHVEIAKALPLESYLEDLEMEIEMQGDLFDRDRQLIHIAWSGDAANELLPQLKSKLLEKIMASFNCPYPIRPIDLSTNEIRGCDLIGCGLSAISQIGDNYCQNTANHATYHRLLLSRRLPVIRGYCRQQD